MSCEYAAGHLETAAAQVARGDVPAGLREIAEALRLIFESGDIPEDVVHSVADMPSDIARLVDALDSNV